ncbi:unnamed protein product [Diabrotica balteata]|uniref:Sodium/potassium-transporting ATPase subunit beta-1-interacting protein n=1 Tax=Diabrotica balteata TaxID=107213 RepID=A0A9N9SUL5_DIABA|nr:unnamed protein product [Diabrotica balteata]
MGICSRRNVFLSICFLQMVAVVERQVFDFLGFLWIPILVNFFEIIFIIFGFFGAYQYRPKYIIAYLLWHLFWIGWNIFMICLYLNVAGLDHEKNKVLKLDLNSDSWWRTGGPGCRVKNVDSEEYEGCFINYVHVEIVQAGIQCFLTGFNSIIGICLSRMFMEEDDTFNYEKPNAPDSILLHPKYVTSDKMYSSNKFLHQSNSYLFFDQDKHKNAKHVHADSIRVMKRRSNSFSNAGLSGKKGSKRPVSLCSDTYLYMS